LEAAIHNSETFSINNLTEHTPGDVLGKEFKSPTEAIPVLLHTLFHYRLEN
jgi:hypothetical protein